MPGEITHLDPANGCPGRPTDRCRAIALALEDDRLAFSGDEQIYTMIARRQCEFHRVAKLAEPRGNPLLKSDWTQGAQRLQKFGFGQHNASLKGTARADKG